MSDYYGYDSYTPSELRHYHEDTSCQFLFCHAESATMRDGVRACEACAAEFDENELLDQAQEAA